jgi:hypothetical protein
MKREEMKMKWLTKEIDMYLQAKEYVDTALIPLIPITTMGKDLKLIVSMGEFIQIITNELERQFKGRLILFPPFTYLYHENMEDRKNRLLHWTNDMKENGIKHVFLISSDSSWKDIKGEIEDSLIWLPTFPLEHMDEQYKQSIITEQMKQLMPLFMKKWSHS